MSDHSLHVDEAGFAESYSVDLLFDREVALDSSAIGRRIRNELTDISLENSGTHGQEIVFSLDREETSRPHWVITSISLETAEPELEAALQQSWNWRPSPDLLPSCRVAVTIADHEAASLPYADRLALFKKIVLAVVESTMPLAIHWRPSQQLVSPGDYVEAMREEPGDILFGAVNVRLFKIEPDADRGVLEKAYESLLLDTLGLAAIGIPDFQCHFRGLDPRRVGALLYELAHYEFAHGRVITTGHHVPALEENETWRCRYEDSIADPLRGVIDLDPGRPYAAGKRQTVA